MVDYTLPPKVSYFNRLLRWSPPRKDQPELLDQGAGSESDVRMNLHEMWVINRWLGGVLALTRHLFPLLRRQQKAPLRIVDIGTGAGEMAFFIARWARQHRLPITLYPLDLSARNLAMAREHEAKASHTSNIHLLQGDASSLPFAPQSVDYYISTLFLHHLSPQQIIDFLAHTYHLAQRGIIMSDLTRGYLPLIAFRLIQPLFARHYLTRHDGILSIRRAYTPGELSILAQAAGLKNVRIYTHFPWRMTLIAEKSLV